MKIVTVTEEQLHQKLLGPIRIVRLDNFCYENYRVLSDHPNITPEAITATNNHLEIDGQALELPSGTTQVLVIPSKDARPALLFAEVTAERDADTALGGL